MQVQEHVAEGGEEREGEGGGVEGDGQEHSRSNSEASSLYGE